MANNSVLTPERIMQVGAGFLASKTLLSAVEIGVFTELGKGPMAYAELEKRLNLHPRAARDFFDALVALGFLERTAGCYRNAPDAAQFLDRNQPGYIGGLLEMANARLYGFWNHLSEALRTGQMQNEAKNNPESSPFTEMYADPARLESFLAAMSGISHAGNMAIAAKAPWAEYRTFADLGAAQGDLAVQIALANPHLGGLGFDLPPVQPIFEEYVAKNGVGDRLRFEAGDFFHDRLPQVDAITMGHILHDWNLEEKKTLLARAYAALNPGGMVVVYDAIIDDDRSQNAFGLLMSLNMLIETPGGFDYTGGECMSWMREVGFRDTRVEHLAGPDSMVLGIK